MKFLSIPNEGSSWRGRLCYSFAIDGDDAQNILVEILNSRTNELLGKVRLFGVTGGEVDIAPYIRPYVSLKPAETLRQVELLFSPSAIGVVVRVNGTTSEVRHFFRSKVDSSAVGVLSSVSRSQEIAASDTIRLTIYAATTIETSVVYKGRKVSTVKCDGRTDGMPMEFVVGTQGIEGLEMVSISVRCDGKGLLNYDFVVRSDRGSAQRLVWYNAQGGIEGYLFDHAMCLGYGVTRTPMPAYGDGVMSTVGRVKYRLCSGYGLQAEMERVAQLLLSPVVYREAEGVCRAVEVDSRDIAFDRRGLLHSITLDVSEEWRGGDSLW